MGVLGALWACLLQSTSKPILQPSAYLFFPPQSLESTILAALTICEGTAPQIVFELTCPPYLKEKLQVHINICILIYFWHCHCYIYPVYFHIYERPSHMIKYDKMNLNFDNISRTYFNWIFLIANIDGHYLINPLLCGSIVHPKTSGLGSPL